MLYIVNAKKKMVFLCVLDDNAPLRPRKATERPCVSLGRELPGFFFFCIGVYNFGLSLYARYVFSLYRLTLFLNDCQPQANLEALIGRPHSMFNNNLLLLWFSPSFTVTEENKRGSKEESSKYILRLFAVLFTHSFTYKQLPNATFL